MAAWIEEIPQWVELYPEWVEGLATPQWVECGWTDFNPQWIDGPLCPAVTAPSTLGGAPPVPTPRERQRKKLQAEDEIVLTIVLKCFSMITGNPYGEIADVDRHKM